MLLMVRFLDFLDLCALNNGLKRTADFVPAIKRRHPQGGRPERLAPVWLLTHNLTREEQAQIDLRASGRTAPHIRLGRTNMALFKAKAMLRLEPDIGLVACFSPELGTELALDYGRLGSGGMLVRPSEGRAVVERAGQQSVLSAREAIFLTGDVPTTLHLTDVDRVDCLVVTGNNLTASMIESSRALRVFPQNNDTLLMLGNYGAALLRGLMPISSAVLLEHATRYMSELVDIMCREVEAEAFHATQDRPATRLNAIKSDIEACLEEQSLTAGQIAERHGISMRYLQKLFEAEGLTFSEFVLQRRLDRALRRLQSADAPKRSISQIAFDVGFGDLSYFNRTFRKRFDMSPRLARAKCSP